MSETLSHDAPALGTAEELPADYRAAMQAKNLVPLWPSMRAFLPHGAPRPQTQPALWRYADVRPLLLRAGELTPIEKAERRVLVFSNPGHGLDGLHCTGTIYVGMQLILPGENAPSHRHTPAAVRLRKVELDKTARVKLARALNRERVAT